MKTYLKLLGFLRPFIWDIFLSVFAGLATIAAGIGMLGTSAFLISYAALQPSIADLQVAIVGVRFFGISRGIFRYLERLLSHSVNLKVLANMRVWFYRKIEPLAPAGLQKYHSGDLLDRIMADLETLQDFYVRVVSPMIVALVVTAGMSLIVGSYAPQLGLILFAGMAMNGFVLPSFFILLTSRNSTRLLTARSSLSTLMLEYFQGLEDLQAAGAEDRWLIDIEKTNSEYSSLQITRGMITGINDGLVLLVSNSTALAVMVFAIPIVHQGLITGISLAVVTMLTMASFEAVNPLPLAAQNLMACLAAAKRLFEVASGEEQGQQCEIPSVPVSDIRSIRVKDLTFHYPGSPEYALDKVDLTIERGRKTALVGPSGAGKTSLVNLLLRFWKPDSGEITCNGGNGSGCCDRVNEKLIGILPQNAYIFSETLRNNLLIAKPEATENDLLTVLSRVDLQRWFGTLPDGLDTWLGERGQLMSGGERQRLALARVLLQDKPFVIMDEPTSHLDPDTAHLIMRQMLSVLSDRGILLVSHQLEFLAEFDQIYFMQGGKIIESGNEKELIRSDGPFKQFIDLLGQPMLD